MLEFGSDRIMTAVLLDCMLRDVVDNGDAIVQRHAVDQVIDGLVVSLLLHQLMLVS
jgi:hypothetical protein